MPRKLHLSPDLSMPLDAVTGTFGIFGQRGTGKSTTGAVLVEQIAGIGGRSVILDPTDVWWGLTRAGDGPGLPGVVLGGEHADAPLEPLAGKVVAEFVIASDYPVVVLSMRLMRKHQRQHFAMEFLEALYHDNREPLMVVLDEGQQFAPTQMREGGDVPRLLGAVEDIVKLGRSSGLGCAMIEQRLAALNANVREQIATIIAHGLVGPLDRKAFKEWVSAQGDIERETEALALLAKLDVGQAVVWSPRFLKFFGVVQMNNAVTFDSRATPKVGQRVKKPGKRAEVSLDSLRQQMAATIEEAERNDPKKLHAEIARLQRELSSRPGILQQVEVEKIVEVPVITEADLKRVEKIVARVERVAEHSAGAYEALREVTFPLAVNVRDALTSRVLDKTRPAAPPRITKEVAAKPSTPLTEEPPRRGSRSAPEAAAESRASGGASEIGTSARHFLATMARFYPMRLTLGQLGTLAQRKTRGGSFNTAMRQLRDGGYVADDGQALVLTERGIAESGVTPEPMTLERWMDVLPMAARELLQALVDALPDALTVEDAAARAGGRQPRGGSWNTAVKMLVSSGLVEKVGTSFVVNESLF